MGDRQEILDRFFWQNGPCCAGCDHWRHINSLVGECAVTPPNMSGQDRSLMIGLESLSAPVPAGYAITRRGDQCGSFKDSFPWASLPLPYLKRMTLPCSVQRKWTETPLYATPPAQGEEGK